MVHRDQQAPIATSPHDTAGGGVHGNMRALVLGTVAFVACFYAWSLYGPLGPALQRQVRLSDIQIALLVAIPVVLGSLMRIPMGLLTDRFGGRATFACLMAFSVLPLVSIGLWHASFPVLLVFGFLLGVAGASFAVGVPFVSGWYGTQRQGFALGVYGMGMGGTVLGGLTAPRLADAYGLGAPFFFAAALIAVMAVLFFSLAQNPPTARREARNFFAPLSVFRTSRRAWALMLFYFLVFGGFVAMFLYLPKMLVDVHHLTRTDAGARAAGFALLAVVARPIGGTLSDRIGAERVLLAVFAGITVFAALLAVGYTAMFSITILTLSLAVMFGLGTGAVFRLVAVEFPKQVGAVTGAVGAAGGLGGFFPPLVLSGVKAATGGYGLGYMLLAATAGACLLILLNMVKKRDVRTSSAPAAG